MYVTPGLKMIIYPVRWIAQESGMEPLKWMPAGFAKRNPSMAVRRFVQRHLAMVECASPLATPFTSARVLFPGAVRSVLPVRRDSMERDVRNSGPEGRGIPVMETGFVTMD